MVVAQNAHTAIEDWLEDSGVTEFELRPQFKLSQVDREDSRHNQARFRAVDEDRVLLVAEAMERNPDRVPPIVVYRTKGNKYTILDGNHRDEAATTLLDLVTWPAYVVTQALTETQIRILTYTANLDHGQPTSMEERLMQAIWLIEERGATQADAARAMKVPLKKVTYKVQIVQARKRLEALGLNIDRLGIGHVARIDHIRSDEVAKQIGELIQTTRMNTTDASNLITRINRVRSEKDQLAIVDQEREARAKDVAGTAKGKVALPKSIQKVSSILNSLNRIDVSEIREAPVDETIRSQLRIRAAEAIPRLKAIIEVL